MEHLATNNLSLHIVNMHLGVIRTLMDRDSINGPSIDFEDRKLSYLKLSYYSDALIGITSGRFCRLAIIARSNVSEKQDRLGKLGCECDLTKPSENNHRSLA